LCSFQSWQTRWFAFAYPVHENYEKERRQNAPLPETNAHMEWFWFLTIDTNTDFRFAVKRLNGKQQLTINHISAKRFKIYVEEPGHRLFHINKACKVVFAIFPWFLKDLLQSKDLVRGAATWTKSASSSLHFSFHSISFQCIWYTLILAN